VRSKYSDFQFDIELVVTHLECRSRCAACVIFADGAGLGIAHDDIKILLSVDGDLLEPFLSSKFHSLYCHTVLGGLGLGPPMVFFAGNS
jgi:hypothetical protein